MSLTDMICDEEKLRSFEGDSGVESLNRIAEVLGYQGHGFRYGTPLECFLSDNPGAQQALLEWIDAHSYAWEDVQAEYSTEDEKSEDEPT